MILEIAVTTRHQAVQAVVQAVGIPAHHGTRVHLGIQAQQIGAVIGNFGEMVKNHYVKISKININL